MVDKVWEWCYTTPELKQKGAKTMGYYVQIKRSTAVIPADKLKIVYEKMCALNTTHDHLKRGGSWTGGKQDSKWFSWLDANYPQTCKDAKAVLEQLGFDTMYNEWGDLHIIGYDNKTGQEELFLSAIENDIKGKIEWMGEDGDTWTTLFYSDFVIDGEVSKAPLLLA